MEKQKRLKELEEQLKRLNDDLVHQDELLMTDFQAAEIAKHRDKVRREYEGLKLSPLGDFSEVAI